MAKANDESLLEDGCSRTSRDEDPVISQWRKAIRDEVEEDLQRQVYLRLQIDSVLTKKPAHPATVYSQLLKLRQQKIGSAKVCCDYVQFPIATEQTQQWTLPKSPELAKVRILQQQELQQKQNRLSEYVIKSASDAEVLTQDDLSQVEVKCKVEEELKLPGIFQYVNSKYGAPQKQLKNLLEKGCYDTRVIDTSGVGTGPNIKCPVESNIFLPTPSHGNGQLSSDPCSKPLDVPATHFPDTTEKAAQCSIFPLVFTCGHEIPFERGVGPNTLKFESRFESGNLSRALQISSQEYILMLSPDLYSKRHTQWFYFRVTGMQVKSYIFKIVNFTKPDSLYNHGMQPLLYSERKAELSGNGWARVGYDITYATTKAEHLLPEMKGNYYTLSWTMEFPYSDDTCYLAHCFPYPYTQMLSHLSRIQQNPLLSGYISQTNLCTTLAGNAVPVLTITDTHETCNDTRPGIVITARVHPGETNSSWMVQGVIDFLLSESDDAKNLRRNYIFKIVPMLNPDGVIVGNYRTSLAGVDLNRVYKSPQADLFPPVYHVKTLIQQFMEKRKLLAYIDLHGHSRKHNVFMYGCHRPSNDHLQLLKERVIPFMMSQQAPQMFDFKSCKFCVQKCKEATGRVVTWKMGVANSYTMESTFGGSTLTNTKCHFTEEDFMSMGKRLAQVFHQYHQYCQCERYKNTIHSQLAETLMSRSQHKTSTEPIQEPACKKSGLSKVLSKFTAIDVSILEEESSTSGSDSENDEFMWKMTKTPRGKRRKRKIKGIHHSKTPLEFSQLVRVVKKSHSTLHGRKARDNVHSSTSSTDNPAANTTQPNDRESNTSNTSMLPSGWRFVNKYQNRSNGGIPIFSEERLQERRKKKNMQIHASQPTTPSKEHSTVLPRRQTWPRHLEPLLDSELKNSYGRKVEELKKTTGTNYEECTRQLGHLKISSQLAKYISDTWQSYQ